MNNIFSLFTAAAISEYGSVSSMKKDWEERIRKQWRESANLPRKKKKAARKNLNLEWMICQWDPFSV